ncbi:MAG: hypothetical protein NT074_06765 [Methanomicrobiales archaeon]|nr:hypothetical protein [Methanomicrobiales archaeon]
MAARNLPYYPSIPPFHHGMVIVGLTYMFPQGQTRIEEVTVGLFRCFHQCGWWK